MLNDRFGRLDTSGETKGSNIMPCLLVIYHMIDITVDNGDVDISSTSVRELRILG